MHITGELASETVIPWICHRAGVLDLKGWVTRNNTRSVDVTVIGPGALVDAMEVACLLGAGDAQVHTITRSDLRLSTLPNSFEERASH